MFTKGKALGNIGFMKMKEGLSIPVMEFNVACRTKKPDPQDPKKKKTQWVRCVAFGKTAEYLEKYGNVGNKVYVYGDLVIEEYTAKDGAKKLSVQVEASEVSLLGGGNGSANKESEPAKEEQPTWTPGKQETFDTDDIPF